MHKFLKILELRVLYKNNVIFVASNEGGRNL